MCLYFLFRYLIIGVLFFICAVLRTLGWKAGSINTSGTGIPWGLWVNLLGNRRQNNLILTDELQEDLEPAMFNLFHQVFNFLSSSKYSAVHFSRQRMKSDAWLQYWSPISLFTLIIWKIIWVQPWTFCMYIFIFTKTDNTTTHNQFFL